MKKTVDDKGKIYAKYPNDLIVRGIFFYKKVNYVKENIENLNKI